MNENLNQKSKIEAPPDPEMEIRTMNSDIESLKQSGGEEVLPDIISLPNQKDNLEFEIPGYIGPEKPIFSPTSLISEETTVKTEPEFKRSKWKLTGIIIGILVVIAIFGFLGYFVISPWIFSKEMPIAQ